MEPRGPPVRRLQPALNGGRSVRLHSRNKGCRGGEHFRSDCVFRPPQRRRRFYEFLLAGHADARGGDDELVLEQKRRLAHALAAERARCADPVAYPSSSLAIAAAGLLSGPSIELADASGLVVPSCLPLWLVPWPLGTSSAGDPEGSSSSSSRTFQLSRALSAACIAQASVATLDFALQDPVSGIINCGIATLGLQAASPQGYRFLPSYIVLAFANGTMQVILAAESASQIPMLWSTAGHVSMKVAHAVNVLSPMVMFVGLTLAWQLHCELRSILREVVPGGLGGLPGQPTAAAPAGAAAAGTSGVAGDVRAVVDGAFRPFTGERHRLEVDGK
eukprot:gnl/TRDRNA2_/TRDRNA2_44183_c0_seq1.p1 gnl/TRDRNA2_/TRDRNA2_44183_c0~~gnl/TRDRNA2_/TRDRNA2_44183_c0_seq1.p1  ORF type:complete len:333 (+),score=45.21 gnl/TRDRNA2_/TRDRNA2_44183_c0_seq1:86-1084(+)